MLEVKTKKNKTLTIRLTEQELEFIKNNADALGLSVTDLIKLSVNSYLIQHIEQEG